MPIHIASETESNSQPLPQNPNFQPQLQNSPTRVLDNPNSLKVKFAAIKWEKGNFYTDKSFLNFEPVLLLTDITSLNTPIDYLSYFFTDEMYNNIQTESQLFSLQKNNISKNELKK